MPDPTSGLPVPQNVIDTLITRITQRSAFIGAGAAGVELLQPGQGFGGNFAQRNKWAEDTTRAEVIDGNASTPTVVSFAAIYPNSPTFRANTSTRPG